ncbi:hypothetical protein GCM10023093_06270 [Nemorincola caseinilytica]|uniref:N-acetyltransferase domain-containing protein n=1 Tax=Nemorincola caseinilytica TaxID=2054315 RepID=A0ABP8N548_9BACT
MTYRRAYRNKGYMTEAMQAVIAHGFGQMGLNRIEAFVGTRNEPSLRLMQHFGFTKEGLLRSHYCKNGVDRGFGVFFAAAQRVYRVRCRRISLRKETVQVCTVSLYI